MECKLETRPPAQVDSGLLVLGVFQDQTVADAIKDAKAGFAEQFLQKVTQFAQEENFKASSSETLVLPTYGELPSKKLVLVGLGKTGDYTLQHARKLAANVARRFCLNGKTEKICFFVPSNDKDELLVQALVEGAILGSYSFNKYRSGKDEKKQSSLQEITIGGCLLQAADFDKACKQGEAIAESVNYARQLIAEPANYLTPSRLAEEARTRGQELGLTVEILEQPQIEKLGMGSFLGVARGAKELPRLIVMRYKHDQAKKTVALVGKGITFDSGGLSLKPAQSMEHMKYDMSGAACVIASALALAKLKPKVNLLVVVGATENMPGGQALHPGDVVTAMNGKTIEVNNTDAEGRLVLADALCYALQEGADEVVDVATLTGACVTALGRAAAGIMGNSQEFIDSLIASGEEAGEKFWQLPMYDEYKDSLKSDIADLKNAGSRGEAGTSCAAMFLKEFVDARPWAHMDVAGPSWLDKDKDELNKGGTAFSVRTLCYYVLNSKN
ncbi:MAG: leucyl aminopeptidase [Candidatus Obscuribacterales bacterium]|nr:leucyl aminopeptidase [Candidatus Obscuribacterales bacterium]